MDYSTILVETKGRKALITLNRPEAMNAMNARMNEEVSRVLDEIGRADDLDVVIITGAGRAFCAGLDLKEFADSRSDIARGFSMLARIYGFEKPVIAAVNGFAITGGFELALSCDIIVASDRARFADTHSRVGVLPAGGLSQILPRLVGIKKAKELSFTGNYMDAREAYQFGLVNHVVPHDELLGFTEKLAEDIISADQWMVRNLKRIIDQGEGLTLEEAMRLEREEHLRQQSSLSRADVGQRRADIFERGRDQAVKQPASSPVRGPQD